MASSSCHPPTTGATRRTPPRSPLHRIEAPEFAEAYGTGVEGAVLVRPDGFIAWRARTAPQDGGRELSTSLAQILDRR